MPTIDLEKLEDEVLREFFANNILEDQIPEHVQQIARIAVRLSVMTVAKVLNPPEHLKTK
jgi:hypothetical protein